MENRGSGAIPGPRFDVSCIMSHRRIIGIDFGTKRVGVAVSDPLRMFAQSDGTYTASGAVARLTELQHDPGFDLIVVGWPLTPDGEEGEATERVQPFVNRLRNQFPSARVVTWDERFSSARAREALVEAGVRKKARRRKERVDAAAAAIILQEFLDEGLESEA